MPQITLGSEPQRHEAAIADSVRVVRLQSWAKLALRIAISACSGTWTPVASVSLTCCQAFGSVAVTWDGVRVGGVQHARCLLQNAHCERLQMLFRMPGSPILHLDVPFAIPAQLVLTGGRRRSRPAHRNEADSSRRPRAWVRYLRGSRISRCPRRIAGHHWGYAGSSRRSFGSAGSTGLAEISLPPGICHADVIGCY